MDERDVEERDGVESAGEDLRDVREFWDAVAEDWRRQVGRNGDANRRFNSDPVLWRLAGDVRGRTVLDAGCGTGYLTAQLHQRGARVLGVDVSPEMIRLAAEAHPHPSFRVDSVSDLGTVGDRSMDLVVSNYVLMDTPDLEGAVEAFHRVLVPGGAAVLVFSHPCFPQGRATAAEDGSVRYTWDVPYFGRRRCTDPPWGHFSRDFIWYHRPLSDYWQAFVAAGFAVEGFEEPRMAPELHAEVESPERLRKLMSRPYSVAFRLRKPSG